MVLHELIQHLESIAPPQYQEAYDNSGLITGDPDQAISGVLTCLDAIESVVDEAIDLGFNVIVAHHPILFKGIKKLTGTNYVERTLLKAVRNHIAIYAIHTNLDHMYLQGVNSRIAQKLGLVATRILAPKSPADPMVGAGMIGRLPIALDEITFLDQVKSAMNTPCIRHTNLLQKPVRTVAICGGSGGFLLDQAIFQQADFLITADFKYHEFFDANDQIVIADIGHFESEQFTIELLQEIITEKFSNFAVRCTKQITNPVNYYI